MFRETWRLRSTPISAVIEMRKSRENCESEASGLISSRGADKTRRMKSTEKRIKIRGRKENERERKKLGRSLVFQSQKPWDFLGAPQGKASIFSDGAKGGYTTVFYTGRGGTRVRDSGRGGRDASVRKSGSVKHRRFLIARRSRCVDHRETWTE